MAHGECNFILFFHFALFFCPFTPILARKIKVLKYDKKRLEISSFYILYQKLWSNDVLFLRHSARRTDGQMDGQTDGRTEKVTHRGRCLLKMNIYHKSVFDDRFCSENIWLNLQKESSYVITLLKTIKLYKLEFGVCIGPLRKKLVCILRLQTILKSKKIHNPKR